MRIQLDCVPCIERQALEAARHAPPHQRGVHYTTMACLAIRVP